MHGMREQDCPRNGIFKRGDRSVNTFQCPIFNPFLDPRRVIVEDMIHSTEEDRFYCIGQVDEEILTVRFTFSRLVTGEKGGRFMKRRIKYTDEPMGDVRIIRDFLPPPEQLVLKEDNVKVTISLS
jgi:hypothetical protein